MAERIDQQDRRSNPRPTLGISQQFDDQLYELAKRDPFMDQLVRLFWRDMSGYAIENGHRLDRAYKRIGFLTRFIATGAMIIALLMVALGVVTVISLTNSSNTAHRVAKATQIAIQTSRFDGAYRSCQATNTRHDSAVTYINSLKSISPAAAITAASLLNVLAPLRDGKQGRISCTAYAAQQTTINVPSAFGAPKPPPKSVTQTTVTSSGS